MKLNTKNKKYDSQTGSFYLELTPKQKIEVFKEEIKSGRMSSYKKDGKTVVAIDSSNNLKSLGPLSDAGKSGRLGYIDGATEKPKARKRKKPDPKNMKPRERELYEQQQKIEKKLKKVRSKKTGKKGGKKSKSKKKKK